MQAIHLCYPNIGSALVDLHLQKHKALVFQQQHIGLNWNDIVKQILSYANGLFDSAVNLVKNVAWEALYTLQASTPNFLASLLGVIDRLQNEKSLSSTLYDAFYVGAIKLWSFLSQLIPIGSSNIGEQIKTFGSLLNSYGGSAIWQAMQYLYGGVKKLIEALLSIYYTAVEKLGEFSSLFVTGMSYLTPVKERCTQIILFSFMMMQNTLELGKLNAKSCLMFLQMHADRLSAETKALRDQVEALNPVTRVITVLLQNDTLQRLLAYIAESTPFAILRAIFNFVQTIIDKVASSVISYVNAFAVQSVNYMVDIIRKLFPATSEQNNLFNMTKAAESLSTHEKVDDKHKQRLKEAAALSNNFQTQLGKHNKYENVPLLISNTWFASRVVSDLYYEKPVSMEEQDRLCKDTCGLSIVQVESAARPISELLENRIFAAYAQTVPDKEKVKIDMPIGGQNDDNDTYKEQIEKQTEIDALDAEIERLQTLVKNIQKSGGYLKSAEIIDEEIDKAIYNAQKIGYQELQVAVNVLNKQKLSLDERYGISELKAEIKIKKERKEALQASIYKVRSKIRESTTLYLGVVMVLVIGVSAWYAMEKMRFNAKVVTQSTFKEMLEASKFDPLLNGLVQKFAENEGIGRLELPESTLYRFEQYYANLIFDIRNQKMSVDQIERDWGFLIGRSIKIQNRQFEEEKKGGTVGKTITAVKTFWGYLTGKKPQDLIDDGGNNKTESAVAIASVAFDKTASGLLKNYNMNQFLQGAVAYPGGSMQEKRDIYCMDVANILAQHNFQVMTPIFYEERMRLHNALKTTVFSYFADLLSYGYKQSGAAGADTQATFGEMLESISKGGAGFIGQQVAFYAGFIDIAVTGLKMFFALLLGLCQSISAYKYNEHQQGHGFMSALPKVILFGVAQIGATALKTVTQVMLQRFTVLAFVINLILTFITWFSPAGWIWAVIKSPYTLFMAIKGSCCGIKQAAIVAEKNDGALLKQAKLSAAELAEIRAQRSSLKLDSKMMQCQICFTNAALPALCSHCERIVYCSEGCADLHWPTHHAE
jgi:hypothetical protein